MDSYRKTGISVGLLFISATVASLLSAMSLDSVLDAPNYLLTVSASGSQMVITVILWLIAATSAVATSFMLYPIIRKHIESLSMGYVVLRIFENILYVIGAVSLLVMLSVSQSYVAGAVDVSYYQALGILLQSLQHWSVTIGTLVFFGLGSMALNYVLYQSQLIPRWLSLWGLIGAFLALLYGLLAISGLGTGLDSQLTLLAMPIFIQEMLFAVWLIVKGFNSDVITSGIAE